MTTVAVNFHSAMTMRDTKTVVEETDILSSQQMSVTVENATSLSFHVLGC